jgi:hypothetical protein
MSLTIAYITCRKEPMIDWFFDSLMREIPKIEGAQPVSQIIIVDHNIGSLHHDSNSGIRVEITPPKPNVWNGPHRLTKQDWFAAANMRNTALCLCASTHIAFVDDLSVLLPGWLSAVYEAIKYDYVGCGAYKKVKDLVVVDGNVIAFKETESGLDDRLRRVDTDISPCGGGWLYGCSFVAPLEWLLDVGGFPEICDGLGSEDYCLGIALENSGRPMKYDRRMMTLESEERHFTEPQFRRTDKGTSPNDKSHAVLNLAKQSKYFPNYYEGGIRALRAHVLEGNPFPVVQIPTHDWYDSQPIAEMG